MALRRLAFALFATFGLLAAPALALAHPLGNFTANHYSRLEISAHRVAIRYVLDLAEIPTFQEMATLDADGDGIVTDAEKAAYAPRRLADIRSHLSLSINGAPAALSVESSTLDLLPGQGGLNILRLSGWLVAPMPDRGQNPEPDGVALTFRDDNDPDRIGWREIVLKAGDGITFRNASAPSVDVSDELRSYPTDLLTAPLDRREARVTLELVGAGSETAPSAGARTRGTGESSSVILGPVLSLLGSLNQVPVARPTDTAPGVVGNILGQASSLTRIVAAGQLGGSAVAIAFLLAALWGAAHALSPGHGKTIVAAYLVGSRGTARHAVFLGLTVTATHTLGIYVLGLLTLVAARYVVPETLYPWLSLAAGLAVVAVGLTTLRNRIRGLAPAPFSLPTGDETGLEDRDTGESLVAVRRTATLATHSRESGHDHVHPHGDHSHSHEGSDPMDPAGRHSHGEVDSGDHHDGPTHDRTGYHSHGIGGHSHSHLPPGADGSPVTWRNLLALGVAGGLLPCPSALVLMLGAIAVGQVAFGLALVAAFSAGLAVVLTAIGIAFVSARRLLATRRVGSMRKLTRVTRLAPVGSAALISILGLGMAVEALAQTGLLGKL